MPTIKDTITTLATDAGYDGDRPQTIADAIEAYGTVAGGGGGGGGVVHLYIDWDDNDKHHFFYDSEYTNPATAKEIYDMFSGGAALVAHRYDTILSPVTMLLDGTNYSIAFSCAHTNASYSGISLCEAHMLNVSASTYECAYSVVNK